MLNKAVGYSGFRTYGELPYPSRKQGKDLELNNQVWESTVREVDHKKPLDNFRNSDSIYKKSYLENTYPNNYHPDHVPKGGARTLEFPQAGSIKAYDREEAQRYGTKEVSNDGDTRKCKLLQTGVEHWKTNYQNMNGKSISLSKTETQNSQKNNRNFFHIDLFITKTMRFQFIRFILSSP